MGEHDNTVFVEEVRTELMSMYTGMALQGMLAGPNNGLTDSQLAEAAVNMADSTITALEEYHLRRKDELIAKRQGHAQMPIDLGNVQ